MTATRPAARAVRALLRHVSINRRTAAGAALLAAIGVLPVLLYLPFLNEPFERDEGVYATIARGLLEGQVPYRDLFDHKPPLIYGWYALSFLLFGEGVVAPRLTASLVLSATALLLFLQARLVLSRRAGYLAAGIFAASAGIALLQPNANTEVFMLLPLTASLLCFTVGVRSAGLRWFLMAGALGGLAVMTKPVAAWNLAALAVVAAVWGWRAGVPDRRRLEPALWLVAGGLAAIALVMAPFVATGAMDDFFYANVRFNLLYAEQLSPGERLSRLVRGLPLFVLAAGPLVATAALGIGAVLRRRWWPHDQLLLLWAAASALGVASPGRFYPHYFVHLLPAMALLSAAMFDRARFRLRPTPGRLPALALLGGLTAFAVSVPLWSNLAVYLRPTAAERHVAKFPAAQAREENAGASLGAYLAERTRLGDTIYNFGRDSQLYFYADRRPAAKYLFDRSFWLDPATLDETVEALLAARPAYVVDTLRLRSPHRQWGATVRVAGNYYPPAFAALLADHYEFVGHVQYADVYRLRPE